MRAIHQPLTTSTETFQLLPLWSLVDRNIQSAAIVEIFWALSFSRTLQRISRCPLATPTQPHPIVAPERIRFMLITKHKMDSVSEVCNSISAGHASSHLRLNTTTHTSILFRLCLNECMCVCVCQCVNVWICTHYHWCCCCFFLLLFLYTSTQVSRLIGVFNGFYIGGREHTNSSVYLPFPPIVVWLLQHLDAVFPSESKLVCILRLKVKLGLYILRQTHEYGFTNTSQSKTWPPHTATQMGERLYKHITK